MTLTIDTKEDEQRQLTLTIEVDEARVQQAMREKARELGKEFRIPGFRQGKAPYSVIVRRIGETTLRAETIEDLIQPVFEEALEEAGIDPYAQPTLENIEPDPVVFTFTIPLAPQVTLGAYRETRKDVEEVEVTEEALQQALEYAQNRHQQLDVVDRAAAEGDVVTISGSGQFTSPAPKQDDADDAEDGEPEGETGAEAEAEEGEMLFREESLEVLLDPESLFPETPFVENLVGMAVGDQKKFTFSFPDEYELENEFAGREAAFDVTLLEVKNREVPPIDDELAKLEGDYEDLEAFKAALRAQLAEQAEEAAKEQLIEEMTDTLLEDAEMVFAPAAVELQIDDMVEDFKNRLTRSGWQPQDYLQLQGLTEETLRDDFRENAETQLRRQLALRQFILDEKLRVEAADIDGLIEARVERFADNETLQNSMRDYYRTGPGFDAISSEVLRDKVYERIVAILSGEAPDLAELEAALDAAADEEE